MIARRRRRWSNSIYITFAVSGLVYYALMRDRIGSQAEALKAAAHAPAAEETS